MQSVTFQVPGKPQGKARAKTVRNKSTGNIHSYTPEKDMLYENYIKAQFQNRANGFYLEAETGMYDAGRGRRSGGVRGSFCKA